MLQVYSNRNVFSNSILIPPIKRTIITPFPINNMANRSLAQSFINHSFMGQSQVIANSQLNRNRSFTTSRLVYRSVTPQVRLYVRNKINTLHSRIYPAPIRLVKSISQPRQLMNQTASSKLYYEPIQQQNWGKTDRTQQNNINRKNYTDRTETQQGQSVTDRQNLSTFQVLKNTLQTLENQKGKYKLQSNHTNSNNLFGLKQQKQNDYNILDKKKETIFEIIDDQSNTNIHDNRQQQNQNNDEQIRLYSPEKEQVYQKQFSNKKSSTKKNPSPQKSISQTKLSSPDKNYSKLYQQKQYQDLVKKKRTKGKMKEMFTNYQQKAIPYEDGYYTQISLKKGKKKKKNSTTKNNKNSKTNTNKKQINQSLVIDLKKRYNKKEASSLNNKKELLIQDIEKLDEQILKFIQDDQINS